MWQRVFTQKYKIETWTYPSEREKEEEGVNELENKYFLKSITITRLSSLVAFSHIEMKINLIQLRIISCLTLFISI